MAKANWSISTRFPPSCRRPPFSCTSPNSIDRERLTSKSPKFVDRRPPPVPALIIHPARQSQAAQRSPAARLEEAVGLALALDLTVKEAQVVSLRATTPATLF